MTGKSRRWAWFFKNTPIYCDFEIFLQIPQLHQHLKPIKILTCKLRYTTENKKQSQLIHIQFKMDLKNHFVLPSLHDDLLVGLLELFGMLTLLGSLNFLSLLGLLSLLVGMIVLLGLLTLLDFLGLLVLLGLLTLLGLLDCVVCLAGLICFA